MESRVNVRAMARDGQVGRADTAVAGLLCILGVAGIAAVAPALVQAQTAPEAAAERRVDFNLPSQDLNDALLAFADATGIQVFYESSRVQGLSSSAVTGDLPVQDALARLLAGTGFGFRFTGPDTVSLQAAGDESDALALPPVQIAGAEVMTGTAEQGYRAEMVSGIGPWSERSLQDTPYSINVVSGSLIDNLQATTTPDQVFIMNPVTKAKEPHSQSDRNEVFMRGSEIRTYARNGLVQIKGGGNAGYGIIMEEVEKIEILTGPSGFLYGGGHVGGLVNYVTKRPTEERLVRINAGITSGRNAYLHSDFGGQLDANGTFGYRINLVTQDGETYVDNQDIDRDSIHAAFDWQATDSLSLDVSLSWRDLLRQINPTGWITSGVPIRDADAIDPTRAWAPEWTYRSIESRRAEFGVRWEVSDSVTLRTRYTAQDNSSESKNFVPFIRRDDNTYDPILSATSPLAYDDEGGYIFLDIAFNTASITHKLTMGARFSAFVLSRAEDYAAFLADSNFSLDAPTYVPEPDWMPYGTLPEYDVYKDRDRQFTVGDDIVFNDRWSALVGVSHVEMIRGSYSPDARTDYYAKTATTPTLSLIYKPRSWLTTYASYIEALEQGGQAADLYQGAIEVINAGEILEPRFSEQIEIGAKATVGGMLLTVALFDIEQAVADYAFVSNSQVKYEYDEGRSGRAGLEFTATGRLTDDLTLVGGFTSLKFSSDSDQSSDRLYKAYLEYDVAGIPGLTLNGGASYSAAQRWSSIEGDKQGSYTLVNLGARYTRSVTNRPLTVRLNINNVSDERYWAGGSTHGQPRTIALSADMRF